MSEVNVQQTVRDELDAKYPGMARDAETNPRRAIRLFCVECMGGNIRDAKDCTTTECRLWPFGMAALVKGLPTAVVRRAAPAGPPSAALVATRQAFADRAKARAADGQLARAGDKKPGSARDDGSPEGSGSGR